jgi:hypothetical protein
LLWCSFFGGQILSFFCWVLFLSFNWILFELFKMLCTLATLYTWWANFIWVFFECQFISVYALIINPAEKEWERFLQWSFHIGNKTKLNQGVSKDGEDHKLGDYLGIPLHQHKCRFSNLQTLFLSTIRIRVSLILERLVFANLQTLLSGYYNIICFWNKKRGYKYSRRKIFWNRIS